MSSNTLSRADASLYSPRDDLPDARWQTSSTAVPPTSKPASFEVRFWTLVTTLFMNVCHRDGLCKDSCNVIEELMRLVESNDQIYSPAIVLAVDVVIQVSQSLSMPFVC